jgi:hypothetical protein
MKKIVFITLVLTAFISCKNETKSKELDSANNEELTLLKGEFIYYADAAILQTATEIYGVVIDAKMHELDKQAQVYKKESTDMVPVEIKGKVVPKPENEEGWPFRVEIKDIIKVSKPNPENNVVKIGKE